MNPSESDAYIRDRRRELDEALRRGALVRSARLDSAPSSWRSHLASGLRRTADLLDGCGTSPRWAR